MLKVALFATVAIVSASHAYAWDCTNPANAGIAECAPAPTPTPTPATTPTQHQGQHQSLTTTQLNTQSLHNAINNRINTGGNTQSVVVAGNGGGGQNYRIAPSIVTTGIVGGGADCPTVGVTPAGSGLGGGGGIGASWISPDCNARKLAAEIFEMGHKEDAIELLREHFPELAKAMAQNAGK